MNRKILLLLNACLLIVTSSAFAASHQDTISKKSGTSTVAILELYTSEGCSSCPPAERYLKTMNEKYADSKQYIPLAFHVDYWDYIGWEDPFSNPAHGVRQRDAAQRNQLNSLYTPQFILHGKDFPAFRNIPEAIEIVNKIKPAASIQVDTSLLNDNQLNTKIIVNAENERAKNFSNVYIAISENNLSSQITDGENEGQQLHHDHVVRKFLGPFKLQGQSQLNIQEKIKLDQQWKLADLNLIVFAQDSEKGATHQAIQIPLKNLQKK